MTGPVGMFSSPPTRCVSRQVIRSHHRQKSIHTSDQATTKRRGISRIGEPAMARVVVPTYQPTLKKSERSRRPIISKVFASDVLLVCQLVVA